MERSAPDAEVSSGLFSRVVAMHLGRDGRMHIDFVDGQRISGSLGRRVFDATSAMASSTYVPSHSVLQLRTTRGDEITVALPRDGDLAPTRGRPSVYLDQNHWSTLALSEFHPLRIPDAQERDAAERLAMFARAGDVLLPMSSAHVSETCKQVDHEARISERSPSCASPPGGSCVIRWRFDGSSLPRPSRRYGQAVVVPPPAITLEPNAIHAGRGIDTADGDPSLPQEARWMVHCVRSIGAIVDTMLDAEPVLVEPNAGWTAEFQRFAGFLASDPTGREMRRRRTHAKFIVDLGLEIAEEAHRRHHAKAAIGLGP